MPTDVSDDAPRLKVQQELADLGPGFVAAIVEVRRDLVVDAVHVLPLELTGSLLHGGQGLMQWPHSGIVLQGKHNSHTSLTWN